MPDMTFLRVVVPLVLLLGLSAPVSADPDPCVADTCINQHAVGCTPVAFTGGQPGLKLWPLLNMVDIDLSCITSIASRPPL